MIDEKNQTDEELDEKRPVLARFRILRREGMPPPVIPVPGQRPVKHKGVSCNVMMIEHDFISVAFLIAITAGILKAARPSD